MNVEESNSANFRGSFGDLLSKTAFRINPNLFVSCFDAVHEHQVFWCWDCMAYMDFWDVLKSMRSGCYASRMRRRLLQSVDLEKNGTNLRPNFSCGIGMCFCGASSSYILILFAFHISLTIHIDIYIYIYTCCLQWFLKIIFLIIPLISTGSAMFLVSRTASLQEIEAAPSGSLTGLTSASMRPAWMRPKAISFPLLVLWFYDILCLYRFYIVTYFHKNHKTHRFYSIMVSLISRFGISLSLMRKECKVDRQRRNRRRSFKTSRCLSRFATELNPFTSLRHFHSWRKTWSSGVHWFQHQVCLVWTEVLSGSPPPSQAEDFENEGIWGRAQGADRAPKMFSMAVWQIILYTWYHGMLMTYNLASCMFIGGKVWNMNEMYYRLL